MKPIDPRMRDAAVAASHVSEYAREESPDLGAIATYEKRLHALVEELRHEDGQRTQGKAIEHLVEYANGLIDVVKVQNLELAQREAVIRGLQDALGYCVRLCKAHGIAIPDELMGTLQ